MKLLKKLNQKAVFVVLGITLLVLLIIIYLIKNRTNLDGFYTNTKDIIKNSRMPKEILDTHELVKYYGDWDTKEGNICKNSSSADYLKGCLGKLDQPLFDDNTDIAIGYIGFPPYPTKQGRIYRNPDIPDEYVFFSRVDKTMKWGYKTVYNLGLAEMLYFKVNQTTKEYQYIE